MFVHIYDCCVLGRPVQFDQSNLYSRIKVGCYSCNALDLHSDNIWFKSWMGYWQSWL